MSHPFPPRSCYRDEKGGHELDGFVHTDEHVAFEEIFAMQHHHQGAGRRHSTSSATSADASAADEAAIPLSPRSGLLQPQRSSLMRAFSSHFEDDQAPPAPRQRSNSSPSALALGLADGPGDVPLMALSPIASETSPTPFHRLSSLSVDNEPGHDRRGSLSAEQGTLLPTATGLRRRPSSAARDVDVDVEGGATPAPAAAS